MAPLAEIIAFCDELLDAPGFDDYGPNGLQVPGAATVETVVSGVSAHLELIEQAAAAGAQLAIVHHGLFWESTPVAVSPQLKIRLAALFDADLSLAAYHLPLDAHPELGNNALLRERLGFEADPRAFGDARGRAIGAIGRTSDAGGVAIGELVERVTTLLGREPLVFDAGPPQVRTIGFLSGAGSFAIREAAALGLDALLTGEPAERAMADAREAGLHFIAAGHYATETLGIRALGERVAEQFGLRHQFIDVPNPV